IVPLVLGLVPARSVVDVGCGRGAWLRAFQENGVEVIKGMDGSYVDQSKLLIDPQWFETVDLSRSLTIRGRYELATCLEGAEHLRARSARLLVKALTGASPAVLFSAAIPGQGGTHHINEQWPCYWQSLFTEHRFRKLDPIRGQIWDDARVARWYRQNVYLYVFEDAIRESPVLWAAEQRTASIDLELIPKDLLVKFTSFSGLARELLKVGLRALKRRLPWSW